METQMNERMTTRKGKRQPEDDTVSRGKPELIWGPPDGLVLVGIQS